MAKAESTGSVKRFGVRYGRKVRNKVAKVEAEQKKKHKCPYCSAFKVKRIAAGIWECRKCNSKFTGKAYTLSKAPVTQEVIEEQDMPVEEEQDDEEFDSDEVEDGRIQVL